MRRGAVLALAVAFILSCGPAAAQSDPPAVAVIGDSLASQARFKILDEFAASGRAATLRVAGRSTVARSMDAVRALLADPDPPSIWIITLGHAEISRGRPSSEYRPAIRKMLRTVAPRVGCVRWFDVTRKRSIYVPINEGAARWNRILNQVSSRYDNVEVYHYSHWTRLAPRRYFLDDRLHNTEEGEFDMARLVRQATDGCDRGTTTGPFWDVRDDAPEAGAVAWVNGHHLMNGYGNGSFRTQIGSLTPTADRWTVALAAWRVAGRPGGYPAAPWVDIPRRLRAPLRWISAERLATGYPGNRYRPRGMATRAHVVHLLWGAAGKPQVDATVPWTDGSARLQAALRWLAASEDADLFPGSLFRPSRRLTRAQLAQLLAPEETAVVDGGG